LPGLAALPLRERGAAHGACDGAEDEYKRKGAAYEDAKTRDHGAGSVVQMDCEWVMVGLTSERNPD
jgi:hypothetical protein